MSVTRPRATFVLSIAVSTLAMIACAGNEGEGASSPGSNKPRPADTTEVTMEVTPFDAGGAPSSPVTPTTPPPPTPTAAVAHEGDPSDDPNLGGKQEPAMEKAVAPIRPRLRVCYKKALATDPAAAGSVTFDATVGPNGHASTARFVKHQGLSEDMIGCLLTAVKAMTFDPSKKSQIVTFSFGNPKALGDAGAK